MNEYMPMIAFAILIAVVITEAAVRYLQSHPKRMTISVPPLPEDHLQRNTLLLIDTENLLAEGQTRLDHHQHLREKPRPALTCLGKPWPEAAELEVWGNPNAKPAEEADPEFKEKLREKLWSRIKPQ